jgi:tetratricopeptide (TPR) repeat protein
MKTSLKALALALLPLLAGTACSQVQAKARFKDGNKAYKDEDFKKAIVAYRKAVDLKPDFAEAWFYLGSSHQALYRPGKEGAENQAFLDQAIEAYKKGLEVNPGESENQKSAKRNTLAALTAIYTDDPYKSFETANDYAEKLVSDNPLDPKNQYARANLYEKFGKVDEAEKTYRQVAESHPNDTKACGALAAFYNKALWKDDQGAPRSKFEQAIEILERCANLDPNDHAGYQKVATFYWDKAYRDPLLSDQQKETYADKGLEAVDKALKIKPDYADALIYKGLLIRVKANATTDQRLRQQYLDQAQLIQKQAMDLKKQQQLAEQAAAASAPLAGGSPQSQ